jgi:hypothetical protein
MVTDTIFWLRVTVDEPVLFGHNVGMLENRKNPRYRTLARARIAGILEGDNLLKDLSITGCCVECTIYADIQPGLQYQLIIEPESAANIKDFELAVERMWIRSGGYSTEVGFGVVASPKNTKQFQRYVDYLAYRAALT